MRLLNQHIIRTATGPFFFGLFTITFLMTINALFQYMDLFVSKGVPFWIATRVMILSLGYTLALSVPMSVLIAVLMSVGQLAGDNEITAMKASGISLYAVLRPLLLLAVIIGGGLLAFNHFVYPESNHTLANLLYDIKRSRPMLEVREQMFTDLNDNLTIFVKRKDDLTGRIYDVTLVEKEKPGDISPRLTTAEWGQITTDPRSDGMMLELHDGEIHEMPDAQRPDKYQVIRFKRHAIYLPDMKRDIQNSKRQSRSDREMNLSALLAAAHEERSHEGESAAQVNAVQATLVDHQWNLLDEPTRDRLRHASPMSVNQRVPLLVATRRKVEQAASQAGAQAKIRQSYVRKANKFLVEYHKKLAIPFACLVFTLLGIPMAVTTSRSGRGVSITLALAVFLLYYLCIAGGEKLSDRGLLDPALAMWMGNIILTTLGIPLFLRAVRETTFVRITWPRRLTPAGHRHS